MGAELEAARNNSQLLLSRQEAITFYTVSKEIDTTFKLVTRRRELNITLLLFICCREPKPSSPGNRRSKYFFSLSN